MAHVYILRCADGSYHVGSTRNLGARLHQHRTGRGSAYTKHRLPVELAWSYEFEQVTDAFAADFHLLPGLAKERNWGRREQ